jgi:hypothetical protein
MNLHLPIQYITLENTKGAIKNGQSRETGVIGYTRRRPTNHKKQHNMYWTSLLHKKQDEYKQNKKTHTTQYVLDITVHRKQDEYKQN